MGGGTDTWGENEFEGHLSILTFPAEGWRDPGKWERARESWEKPGNGLGTSEKKEEGGKRREMEKRVQVTLGPVTPPPSGPGGQKCRRETSLPGAYTREGNF